MSVEKQLEESRRWLKQARSDLEAATISQTGEKYEWACFQSQQAAEKAVKSLLIANGMDPWGHSIRALLQRCSEHGLRTDLELVMQDAATLDKLYIPTRYPDGLPDTTPTEAFTEHEGGIAIQAATRILDRVADTRS